MPKLKFALQVSKDKIITLEEPELWIRYKNSLEPGKYWMKEYEKDGERKRHIGQNNLYWLRCQVLADYTGDTKEEMHEILMDRCGFTKEKERFGAVYKVRISSANLSEREFGTVLMKEQDNLARFINNEIAETKDWLILPSMDHLTEY